MYHPFFSIFIYKISLDVYDNTDFNFAGGAVVNMGKRHLTPREIMEQCKAVARESRMCDRSPWSAMGIICGYIIMKQEGFKGKRILNITQKIDEMEKKYRNGEISLDEISKRLMDKADWTIECKAYTENDILAKKGTYQYWIDKKQIEPQNTINMQATRYMLFFFNTLMDEYGFGKDRLTRVQEAINKLLVDYQSNKTTIREWQQALLDEAGIVYEMPIDPMTQTAGSMMTGM